mmetsp:Transcript_84452/g.244136  ORF Transcript_84452/g.244136 Transcript_84452/m.244136 type:complete len:302 (-) Transcript_84452:84-989(-)
MRPWRTRQGAWTRSWTHSWRQPCARTWPCQRHHGARRSASPSTTRMRSLAPWATSATSSARRTRRRTARKVEARTWNGRRTERRSSHGCSRTTGFRERTPTRSTAGCRAGRSACSHSATSTASPKTSPTGASSASTISRQVSRCGGCLAPMSSTMLALFGTSGRDDREPLAPRAVATSGASWPCRSRWPMSLLDARPSEPSGWSNARPLDNPPLPDGPRVVSKAGGAPPESGGAGEGRRFSSATAITVVANARRLVARLRHRPLADLIERGCGSCFLCLALVHACVRPNSFGKFRGRLTRG